jgi:protein gp37
MSDVFEDHPDVVTERQKLWELVYVTPMLDWLLLTKRPENILRMTPWQTSQWPENVWTLTSVENQKQADLRIPSLLDVPSSVRGLSVEPLLGEVDLSQWIHELQWVIVGGREWPWRSSNVARLGTVAARSVCGSRGTILL